MTKRRSDRGSEKETRRASSIRQISCQFTCKNQTNNRTLESRLCRVIGSEDFFFKCFCQIWSKLFCNVSYQCDSIVHRDGVLLIGRAPPGTNREFQEATATHRLSARRALKRGSPRGTPSSPPAKTSPGVPSGLLQLHRTKLASRGAPTRRAFVSVCSERASRAPRAVT